MTVTLCGTGNNFPAYSAGTPPPTTLCTAEDARRKWSPQEMEELVFCFFKARAMGPGYIKRLQNLFLHRNPDNPKIEFNGSVLSTQAKRIISRNAISSDKIKTIKQKAEEAIHTSYSNVPNTICSGVQYSLPSIQHNLIQATQHIITQETNTNSYNQNRTSSNQVSLDPPLFTQSENADNDDWRRKWSKAEMEELMTVILKPGLMELVT
ncbi:hypothetical protein O3G_MSEX009846 [Manduca sexta]|uniref:Uncharacterized protein n=1 Tax=Manduca sexta TaxID=7130 RepID=A0A921ZGL0_MANSE|nr:hypothetical protein O3G_MSEX009846 [Manduca sexta]